MTTKHQLKKFLATSEKRNNRSFILRRKCRPKRH